MPPPAHSPPLVSSPPSERHGAPGKSVSVGGAAVGSAKGPAAQLRRLEAEEESPKTALISKLQQQLAAMEGAQAGLRAEVPPPVPRLGGATEQKRDVAISLGKHATRKQVGSSTASKFRELPILGERQDARRTVMGPGEKLVGLVGAGNGPHVPYEMRGVDAVQCRGATGGLFIGVNAEEARQATLNFAMGRACGSRHFQPTFSVYPREKDSIDENDVRMAAERYLDIMQYRRPSDVSPEEWEERAALSIGLPWPRPHPHEETWYEQARVVHVSALYEQYGWTPAVVAEFRSAAVESAERKLAKKANTKQSKGKTGTGSAGNLRRFGASVELGKEDGKPAAAAGGGGSSLGSVAVPARGLAAGDERMPEADAQLVSLAESLMGLVAEEDTKSGATGETVGSVYTLSRALATAVGAIGPKPVFQPPLKKRFELYGLKWLPASACFEGGLKKVASCASSILQAAAKVALKEAAAEMRRVSEMPGD